MPESFSPPLNLKAAEFLSGLFAKKDNEGYCDYLFELVGLKEHKHKYIKSYSRGMIQRLGIATALLKKPEVLILDDPMLALDIKGQRDVFNIIGRLNESGTTIIFTSENNNDAHLTEYADYIFKVPECGKFFQPIIYVIPLQLLSYYIADFKGCDIDQPRNLAKSVTVE